MDGLTKFSKPTLFVFHGKSVHMYSTVYSRSADLSRGGGRLCLGDNCSWRQEEASGGGERGCDDDIAEH